MTELNNNKYKEVRKWKSISFLLALVFPFLGMSFLSSFYKDYYFLFVNLKVEEILHSLSVAVIEIVIIGVFYESFTKRELLKEFTEEISDVIAFEEEIISGFAQKKKRDLIKKIIELILGQEKGSALFENMVDPYILHGTESFRGSYDYNIDFDELVDDIIIDDISFSRGKYYVVIQDFEYEKFVDLTGYPEQYFSIGFAFEDHTLDCWFREAQCIFREVLRVKNPVPRAQGVKGQTTSTA